MTDDSPKSTLESCALAVWRRTQRKHLSAGLLAMCRWSIPLFFGAMAIDRFAYLPTAGRAVVLLVLLGVSFYQAWRQGWRQLQRFDATRTALAIEEQHGGLESLLVTAVQFKKSGPTSGTSEALWDATQRKAEAAAQVLEPRKIVSFRGLRVPARIALALAGVVLAFALFNGPFLAAGLTRIFAPWVAIAYPTNTHIDLGAGDLVVKEGDCTRIVIGVSGVDGVVPKKARLSLRTGEGNPREMDLQITGDHFEYNIASASRDFSYRVKAGDARSDWRKVRVIKAPRVEQVQVGLEFPAYLDRATETVEALTLTVPEDTKVHWRLTLDRPIRSAVLNRDGEEPKRLDVTDGGRQLVIDEKVEASRGYSFSWVENDHGFAFTSPRYYLQVASDQPPQVELSAPDANLNALLGRQLKLAVRAHDDHGIGSTAIIYRVNMRPEKTVTLDEAVRNGAGQQELNWDYRKEITDLKVGDTVSFLVEVADKYPGPNGPHKARSDTRRLTFLSREEYLAEIQRKKDRLLSRVRTIYRQERGAHELVRQLDPKNESFPQTCQLEAIRQEMLREQLKDTAREGQALLDDLKANNITDAVEGDTLVRVRTGLEKIAEEQVAKAASLLRDQAGTAAGGKADPTSAIRFVNEAARALAGLVLQRDIDSAREVFARESHMLAQEQATLRLLAMRLKGAEAAAALAERQHELATWTDQLLVSLREGIRFGERPIAVLGLTRRIKELRASGAGDKMRQAATLTKESKTAAAVALQTQIVAPLLAAEFSMRTGAEYSSLTEFRATLGSLIKSQKELRTICETLNPGDFEQRRAELAKTQAGLQAMLVSTLLPPIQAPRPHLFDNSLPEAPAVGAIRTGAEQAMTEALALLTAGERTQVIGHQSEAEKQLAALAKILDLSAIELSLRTQGLTTLVSTATDRAAHIEDFEKRQIGLLERTDEAAQDKKNSELLSEPQGFLGEEIISFRKELRGKNGADKDVLPLLSRLDRVSEALDEATSALKANRPKDALKHQEQAADQLAESRKLAQAQTARLTLLQDLYTFQRSVGNASGWMMDIVAEQNDLLAETKAAKPKEGAKLIPVMKNLRQCLTDIAPVLDLVAGRLDAGTPLLFAGTDLEDAIHAVDGGDYLEAADAQTVAAESLAKVQALVQALQAQTGYVAEIVEFLHSTQADAALLAFRQQQLRQRVKAVAGKLPVELIAEQSSLQAEAVNYGRQLQEATGMPAFTQAGERMQAARTMMETGDAAAALAQMVAAETSLTNNAEELLLVITMLHGLPGIEVTTTSPKELTLLLEVLGFASNQRNLSRQTEAAQAGDLAGLTTRQQKLEAAAAKSLPSDSPNPKLVTAHEQLVIASQSLQAADKAKARTGQDVADASLRHFIVEQALILQTAKAASSASSEPVLNTAETTDLSASTASFVSDFVSGEAPKDTRTEWESLGARNRAALNQNFARELPLEYRGTLKNYYERIAK